MIDWLQTGVIVTIKREMFGDYRFKLMEIDRLKRMDCSVSDMVIGSHPESPYTAHPIRVRGVDPVMAEENRHRVEQLEAECAAVEAAIALAPNSQIRLILSLRYIDGDSWADVGRAIGMSEAACRMKGERYLESMTGE